MVTTNRGVIDWLVQRVSAVVILLTFVLYAWFFIAHPQLSAADWSEFFYCLPVRLLTCLALFAILFHAWVGLWTVFTDYIKSRQLRLLLQILLFIWLFICGLWSLSICL